MNDSTLSLNLRYKVTTSQDKFAHFIDLLNTNTNITYINASYNEFTKEMAEIIAKALKFNTTLTRLDLSNSQICEMGIQSIAESLLFNTTISHLNLSRNGYFGARGLCHIATMIEKNTTITHLNLEGIEVEFVSAVHLSTAIAHNTTLTFLNLKCAKIQDNVGTLLINALKHNITLRTLILSENCIGSSTFTELKDALAINSTLTNLDISGCSSHKCNPIPYVIDILRSNNSLRFLNMRTFCIPLECIDDLMDSIERHTSLTSLSLDATQMKKYSTRFANVIKQNTRITSLVLSGARNEGVLNPMIDMCEAFLNLTSLKLAYNVISNAEISIISDVLKCNRMMFLDLEKTTLDNDGALYLVDALKCNTSLKSLKIPRNKIDDTVVEVIVEALIINSTLGILDVSHISFRKESIPHFTKLLTKNTALTSLTFHCSGFTSDQLWPLVATAMNKQNFVLNAYLEARYRNFFDSKTCTVERFNGILNDAMPISPMNLTLLSTAYTVRDMLTYASLQPLEFEISTRIGFHAPQTREIICCTIEIPQDVLTLILDYFLNITYALSLYKDFPELKSAMQICG